MSAERSPQISLSIAGTIAGAATAEAGSDLNERVSLGQVREKLLQELFIGGRRLLCPDLLLLLHLCPKRGEGAAGSRFSRRRRASQLTAAWPRASATAAFAVSSILLQSAPVQLESIPPMSCGGEQPHIKVGQGRSTTRSRRDGPGGRDQSHVGARRGGMRTESALPAPPSFSFAAAAACLNSVTASETRGATCMRRRETTVGAF